jgi:hypothetical protein
VSGSHPAAEGLGPRTVAIAVLGGLVALPAAVAAGLVVPGLSPALVAVLAAVFAAEAVASHHQLTLRDLDPSRLRRFRTAEVAIIVVAVRLATLLAGDGRAEIAGWLRDPLAVLDAVTLTTVAVVLSVWWMAAATAQDLSEVHELARAEGGLPPQETLVRRYLLGVLVVLVAAAAHTLAVGGVTAGVTVAALGYVLVRLGGTLGRVSALIRETQRELMPVINKVGGTVDRVNGQMDKVERTAQVVQRLVDAAMGQVGAGALVAGQSPEGCYDGAAADIVIARGGESGTPARLAERLAERWPPSERPAGGDIEEPEW